jgi:hypothetical protein
MSHTTSLTYVTEYPRSPITLIHFIESGSATNRGAARRYTEVPYIGANRSQYRLLDSGSALPLVRHVCSRGPMQNMMVVCKDRLDRIRVDERMGVEAAAAVEDDINALLAGKSYDHLVALQNQVSAKLASGEPVDVDYWENLLKKLLVWKSKVRSSRDCSMDVLTIMQAKLKAFHEVVVRNRLEQLRKRQRDEALQAQEELLAGVAQSAQQGAHRPKAGTSLPSLAPDEVEVYTRSMSPPLVDNSTLTGEEREMVLSAEDDLRERVGLDTLVSTSWSDRT